MKVRELHEADALAALHVCSPELGSHCRSVLLHHWKEGRLVEGQVLTYTQGLTRNGLKVDVVREPEQFNALAPEWDGLVDRCGVDRVFLAHTWFETWWESFGAGNDLHVVTVRDRGELVALAPMMRTRASIYGVKVHAIQAICNPHTPRYDFVIGNNQDPWLYRLIWNQLVQHEAYDAIVLTQIPEGSRTIATMESLAMQRGWLTGQWVAPASPYIPLDSGYEAFFENLKNGLRYNLIKRYERLRRKGPVDVEIITDPADVPAAMEDGLRIEAAAWKGAEGTAILCDPVVTEFYTRLAKREAELGQLRLCFLRFRGKRIAFSYLLYKGKKLYGIKIGYDPEYHAYSPGNMLLNLNLQRACAQGIQEYDFLGVDDEWKFEWTKRKREQRWLFCFRNRPSTRLLHYFKFSVVPAVKPAFKILWSHRPRACRTQKRHTYER
jgi:CelD/BcsL family acetyltransferase involved in cellulose biosynthesis